MRKTLSIAAFLLAGVVGVIVPTANATTLSDDGYGPCQKPSGGTWTSYGAYSHVHIYDDVSLSSRSAHITSTKTDGDLSDCGPGGRTVQNGQVKLVNSWKITGTNISSCDFTGCSVSGGTYASETYTMGPM